MKLLSVALATAVLVLAAACGGAGTAAPNQVVFNADLATANEVPPIADDEKSGSGKAVVTFDLTRDSAGKISAATAKFNITLSGFPTSTKIILAHIHNAPAGQNGGVKVDTGLKADSAIALTSGGTTIDKSSITVDAALAQDI